MEQNILFENTIKIQKIERISCDTPIELIDITVENDHSFWVSESGESWFATHNCGMADVDTDVSDRDKVLDVLRKEFGYENVVPISNYNMFKVKSLLKDLSKLYGISFEEANDATRTVEEEVRKATTKHGDDKNLFVLTYEDAMKYSESFKSFIERHPDVGNSMNILFKQVRSLGRHAGGVLICDDLPSKMPLIASKGEPQSPFVEGVNFKHLEKIGMYVKYDVLGLATLRLIENTIKHILEKECDSDNYIEITLDVGTKKRLLGNELVKTSNRGLVRADALVQDDDIESFDVEVND